MDFAHVMNGYRYHTKYDHIDYLPPSVLQRTGDNILALVQLIANSNELANTKVRKLDAFDHNKTQDINDNCHFPGLRNRAHGIF